MNILSYLSIILLTSLYSTYAIEIIHSETFSCTYKGELRAYDGKCEVGHILYSIDVINGSAEARISSLNILPEYQRQGIGTSLFKKALIDMYERGAREIYWYSSLSAIPFYEKHGAYLLPDTTNYMKYTFNE